MAPGWLPVALLAGGAWWLWGRRQPAVQPFAAADSRLWQVALNTPPGGMLAPGVYLTGAAIAQPAAGTPAAGIGQLITQQQWWEKYVNNGQPAPPGTLFAQVMVPDSPNGAAVGHSQSRLTGAVT